jgi:recombination DNA repair RAD52 pathway protein
MLTDAQLTQLFRELPENRVLYKQGQAHLAAWDVRRTLTRIFGFTGWSFEVRTAELVAETQNGNRWSVVYRAVGRLTIRDPHGDVLTWWEDGATGAGQNQPTQAGAHDLAFKSAISVALKRCAANLGDQFGLCLYNKGQTAPVVGISLAYQADAAPVHDDTAQVHDDTDPDGEHASVEEEPPEQAVRAVQETRMPPDPQAEKQPKDWAAEASAAKSVEEVRRVYRRAAAAGASQEVLAAITETARGKQPPAGAEASERENAETALYAAAARHQVSRNDLDAYAGDGYGRPLAELTVAEIRDMATMLEKAA